MLKNHTKSFSRRRLLGGFVVSACLAAGAGPALAMVDTELDTPYVQTPDTVVTAMLDLARVGPDDYVIDLGAGDGRLLIEAARRGAQGFGVDIDPRLVELANRNAQRAGVAGRARFLEQDLFVTDLSPATVLTLYLLPAVNLKLLPTVLALKPGTRIVSHDYGFGDWPPDQRITVEAPNKPVNALKTSDLLYFVVPAQVAGTWTGQSGQGPWQLVLNQQFQTVSGQLTWQGQTFTIPATRLDGAMLALRVGAGDSASTWQLQFDDHQLRGEVTQAGSPIAVQARREP